MLYDNRLTGPVPASIGQLKRLTIFAAQDNRLTGPLPPELGGLPELRDLILHSNWITGPLPPELGTLGELTYLDLSNNNLQGEIPSELGELSDLTHLQLNANLLVGTIPEALGRLSSLKVLDLAGNRLTGSIPQQLADLANLESLGLSGNELTGPVPDGLEHLVSLAHEIVDRPHPRQQAITDPYGSDPLGLISRADIYRHYSLQDEVWKVWLCDRPDGDLTLVSSRVVSLLNREVGEYFAWMSGGKYHPVFEYEDTVEATNSSGCIDTVHGRETDPNRFLIVDDTSLGWGFGALEMVFVGGGALYAAPPSRSRGSRPSLMRSGTPWGSLTLTGGRSRGEAARSSSMTTRWTSSRAKSCGDSRSGRSR